MKIAIIADPIDNQSAGIHVFTKNMVHSLLKYDRANEYLIFREKKGNDLPDGTVQIVIPNINLPIGFKSLRLFFIIPFLMRKNKVDVVIEPAHFGPFNLPINIKRVTVIHDLTPILFPKLHRWHSQILQRIFLKHILKKTHLIITNSQNTAKDVADVYPFTKQKIEPVYLGKDPQFSPRKNEVLLRQYGIIQPYFLFVGTIEPRKNLVMLLMAFELLKREKKEGVQLVLVGGKGWRSEAFSEAYKFHLFKDDIILPGFVPDAHLRAFYSGALSFLYPSLYEGFGFPVLEAMACGTPCIVSNTSSLPEVGGDAVIYAHPKNVREWTDAMMQILLSSDLRKELSEKSLAQAKKFNWERFGKKFSQKLNYYFAPKNEVPEDLKNF